MRNQVLIDGISKDELIAIISGIVTQQRTVAPRVEELPVYLNSKETCRLLGVTPTTLWKWRTKGRIQGEKLGSRLRYKTSDVLALLESITSKLG